MKTRTRNQLHDDVLELRLKVEEAVKKFLRSCGWRCTWQTPRSCWMWSKQLSGGYTLLVDADTALRVEEGKCLETKGGE